MRLNFFNVNRLSMKFSAVILAAGKGTRMGELSITTPKPMLKVLNKTLIEHKLDMMPDQIDEVIIVVQVN